MSAVTNKLNAQTEAATTETLTNQMETLRGDLSDLTKKITDLGKSKSDDAIASAKTKVVDTRDIIVGQTETARLHAMELQDQANSFVRTQPATALGIAAGFGFLVGFLATRK